MVGPDAAEAVVTGLKLPSAMDFGPDGALYVGSPTFGADDGQGVILRIDLSTGRPIAVPPELPVGPACPRAEQVAEGERRTSVLGAVLPIGREARLVG